VHVDIKKLGNIPDGGGHKTLGRQAGRRTRAGAGYSYLHNTVDDHSRLAYSEILPDERKETAVAFWTRVQAFFEAAGITVQRVLTDNGSCYKSHPTRQPRPQPHGTEHRFNPSTSRTAPRASGNCACRRRRGTGCARCGQPPPAPMPRPGGC
jgi:hypothetical protein